MLEKHGYPKGGNQGLDLQGKEGDQKLSMTKQKRTSAKFGSIISRMVKLAKIKKK